MSRFLGAAAGLLLAAWLSDRISRRALALGGAVLLLLGLYPFFAALENRSLDPPLAFALIGIPAAICAGTVIAIAADLFPTRIRFTGVALSFNIAFTLFSGLAPVVAALLARGTGNAANAAWFVVGCAALTVAAALVVHRYDGKILRDAGGDASRT